MAIFLNETIQNGQVIGGVAHFVQTTAPTVRSDGSALVAGDFWLNPWTGRIGFWQSPYWLSTVAYYVADIYRSLAATTTPTGQVLAAQLNYDSIFLESVAWGIRSAVTADGSNYWQIQARYDNSGISDLPRGLITVNTNLAAYAEVSATVNTAILLSGSCRYFAPPSFTKTNTPGNMDGVFTYKFRLIL